VAEPGEDLADEDQHREVERCRGARQPGAVCSRMQLSLR